MSISPTSRILQCYSDKFKYRQSELLGQTAIKSLKEIKSEEGKKKIKFIYLKLHKYI